MMKSLKRFSSRPQQANPCGFKTLFFPCGKSEKLTSRKGTSHFLFPFRDGEKV